MVTGLKHQKEKPSLDYFAVFRSRTRAFVLWMARARSFEIEPQALLAVLRNAPNCFKRIGLEAGPLSQWLYGALAEAGLPVICGETRHMRAVLKAADQQTDRNDARGMAQMMRVGIAAVAIIGPVCWLITHWRRKPSF